MPQGTLTAAGLLSPGDGLPGGSDTPFLPVPPALGLTVPQEHVNLRQIRLRREIQSHHPVLLDPLTGRAEAVEDLQNALTGSGGATVLQHDQPDRAVLRSPNRFPGPMGACIIDRRPDDVAGDSADESLVDLASLGTNDGGTKSLTTLTITGTPPMERAERRRLLREALVHMAREFGYVDAEGGPAEVRRPGGRPS